MMKRNIQPFRTAALTLVLTLALCQSALAVSVTRGPYLQTGSPTSVTVRWRTDTGTDSCVRYGTSSSSLTSQTCSSSSVTEHVVNLSSLSADTQYYYSIGTSAGPIAGDSSYFFVTAPQTGTAKATRIWVLGDAGTAGSNQQNVRNGYYNYTGSRHTDLWLMLGDNAYSDGTDSQYQSAVFNMYPTVLRNSVLWPTFGNHDAHSADSSSQSGPYYDIFTLPKNGEAGGVASGTEAYYSFNYGNIHFVCLDSSESNRSPTGSMLTWLKADLAATSQPWLIAFWHHPPYSKGSHDSDSESDLRDMRQYALPILEGYGVDLVLSGHSHSYERSYLLDGHYGLSSSLTSSMILDGGDGNPSGNGAYAKPAGLVAHKGAVYAVNGSSGQTGGGSLNHPAMHVSLNVLGSMVLDINGNRLDAKFLNTSGSVQDSFTIQKGSGTTPFDFSLSNTGSKTVTQGSSVTNTISAALVSGTAQSASFSASGLPSGVTASFTPTACTPNCSTTLTLTAGSSATTGTATVTVTGTGGGVSRTTNFSLTVNPVSTSFNFSLSSTGSKTVTQGSSVTNTISAALVSGTAQSASFSASGLPSGVTASFTPTACTPNCSTTLTLTAGSSATTGTATVTVTGTAGAVSRTTNFSLTVNPVSTSFNFSLGNEGSKSVPQGSSVTNTISAALVSGTAQSVSFSASGLPSGVTASFSPTACTPNCSSTLTLSAGSSATTGTSTVTVTGIGGGITKTTSFSLTVTAPGSTTTISFQNWVLPTTSYSGTRDTRIVSTAPGTNYGQATTLWADGDEKSRVLLRWKDMTIPAGSTVTSATITLNVTDASSGTYNLYEAKRDWWEDYATWNNYGPTYLWQIPGAEGTSDRGTTVVGTVAAPSTGQRTITLNAAGIALVQSWVDSPSTNNGIIIDNPTVADSMGFDSKNGSTASNRPKLTVTYVAP